jgi:divalent metal cation (Fe/Co/Zn/Cd) transporter
MREDVVARAVALSWLTIGYNMIEGVVSMAFGVRGDSVALAGFGADSFIEVASALVVLWRFRGESGLAGRLRLTDERRATKIIGWLFVLLAAGTALASGLRLWQREAPETTVPGAVIATVSLAFMVFLWRAKLSVARALDSATVAQDAACSRACITLSVILLGGSLLYWLAPALWWVDAAAALGLAVLIGREGAGTVRAAAKEEFSGGCGCSSHADHPS